MTCSIRQTRILYQAQQTDSSRPGHPHMEDIFLWESFGNSAGIDKHRSVFSDIKTLVIGNDYRSYVLSEKLNLDIYDKGSLASKSLKNVLWSNYDVIINFSSFDLEKCDEKIIIEMNEIQDLDLSILLNCKKIYFINQLMWHYLTKSGGKIMYDSMVNR